MNYTILDAAVESIENYMKAFDTEQKNVELFLQPYFNTEGETTRIRYNVHLKDDGLSFEHNFEMEQSFKDLDVLDQDYTDWVREFLENFPHAELHYRSTTLTESVIENSFELVSNFKKAFELENKDLAVLVDLEKDENTDIWSIEYHVRTTLQIGEKNEEYRLDMRQSLEDFDEDRVKGEVYPLWIQKFTTELSGAQLYFTDPDELD